MLGSSLYRILYILHIKHFASLMTRRYPPMDFTSALIASETQLDENVEGSGVPSGFECGKPHGQVFVPDQTHTSNETTSTCSKLKRQQARTITCWRLRQLSLHRARSKTYPDSWKDAIAVQYAIKWHCQIPTKMTNISLPWQEVQYLLL